MENGDDLVCLVRQDANDLLRMLPSVGNQEALPRIQRDTTIMLGVVQTGGLSTSAEGDVLIHTPTTTGWAASSEIVKAWAWPTAIDADKNVMLFQINGRFVAVEVC
jgi:hypothetical protein